jgi:hypothetical protein
MTPSGRKTAEVAPEFFRVSPPLLRRLPAIAARPTKYRPDGKLSPKMAVLVLLALFAQVARQPKGKLVNTPARGDAMASVTCPVRMADVLADLGYERNGSDFSGSAWSAVTAAVRQLATTPVGVAFNRSGTKGRLEQAHFRGRLVEVEGERAVRLHGYCAPSDRYFVLMPRKLLGLRRQLTELSTRLACWLYLQHRGRREERKLRHKWRLTVTAELLVEAKILRAKNLRRSVELRRMREGFRNLEVLGLLTIEGSGWPFVVHLSREFFHQEVADA